jgi:hypothetical protein
VYGHPMEKDIKGDTSGVFKMLLVSLAQVQTFSDFAFNLITEYKLKSFPVLLRLNFNRVKEMRIRVLTSLRPRQMPNVCFKLVSLIPIFGL